MACNSGCAGLHMVIRALGIGERGGVIATTFSLIASTSCIMFERATPFFVDIEEGTFGFDPNAIEDATSDRVLQADLLADDVAHAGQVPPPLRR